MRHLLITGEPGIGKTTVMLKLRDALLSATASRLVAVSGFVTREVRGGGNGGRTGFEIEAVLPFALGAVAAQPAALASRAPLAHLASSSVGAALSGPAVGRYVVDTAAFERLALPAIDEALQRSALVAQAEAEAPDAHVPSSSESPAIPQLSLLLIDEIGKMECCSRRFVARMRAAFADERTLVVATVAQRGGGFINEVKAYPVVDLVTVTQQNRDALADALRDDVVARLGAQ